MNYMHDNEWEKFLKSKVEEFEFPYDEAYWQLIEKRLPVKNKKIPRSTIYWSIGALLFLFMAWLSWYNDIFTFEKKFKTSEQSQLPNHPYFIQPQNMNQLQENYNLQGVNEKLRISNSFKTQQNTFENQSLQGKKETNSPKFAQNKAQKPKNSSLNHTLVDKRKQSAYLLITKEKISAICRTIMIYKALKLEAQKYIPLENAREFVAQLENIPTRNLLIDNKKELSPLKMDSLPKKYFEKPWTILLGGGTLCSKFSNEPNLAFRHAISFAVQYSLNPLIFVQTIPAISYGNSLNMTHKASKPLALHLPLELGYHWKRYALGLGWKYEYYFLNKEQKNELLASRNHIGLFFQCEYQRFMLRLSGHYSLNDLSQSPMKQKEWNFGVSLYYQILKR